ncbi:DUF1284 domain-containing protein [bacterium]|nr:DUF1284 domain-containing protein [bacterium]
MDVSDTIKIRAHHLLCIQAFQGHGYSKDFVINMSKIIKDFKNPNREIEIIAECDAICLYCPYNIENICKKNADSLEKIKNMDMQVLKKSGLRNGAKVKAKDILLLLKTKLRGPYIEDICGDCEWKEKCLEVTPL